jgi:hypothetical protein
MFSAYRPVGLFGFQSLLFLLDAVGLALDCHAATIFSPETAHGRGTQFWPLPYASPERQKWQSFSMIQNAYLLARRETQD